MADQRSIANRRLDANEVGFMPQLAICWGLLAGSLVIAAPVVFFKIREHVDIEEDLKFSDATFDEVAPTALIGDHDEKR
jgi:hypothetical protein